MFYYLSSHLKDTLFFANVFHYTSTRAVGTLLTTAVFCVALWQLVYRNMGRFFQVESS